MQYRTAGQSDLEVSVITLGLMVRDCSPGDAFESVRATVLRAVDRGITSIDLATGYGGGAVERAFGKVLVDDLALQRENLVIATKGGWADGSRDALQTSIERSLEQLGVEYVDLYYHHAPDVDTPAEETAGVLHDLVQQGKTRYVGVSNYSPQQTLAIMRAFRALGTPAVMHQPNYNMLNRWIEDGLLAVLDAEGLGAAVFAPLSQGLLSDASVTGPREGSRAAKTLDAIVAGAAESEPAYGRFAVSDPADAAAVRAHVLDLLGKLKAIAADRGQSLEALALSWLLRHDTVTTVINGMSSVEQVDANIAAVDKMDFSDDERRVIASLLPARWGMV